MRSDYLIYIKLAVVFGAAYFLPTKLVLGFFGAYFLLHEYYANGEFVRNRILRYWIKSTRFNKGNPNDETLIQQVSRCMYEELGVEKCEKIFNERDYSFSGENNWIPSILKEIKIIDSGKK